MKKVGLVLLLSAFTFAGIAQEYNKHAEEYSKTITVEDLRKHLSIIASDKFEGRETGKKGQKMAMDYLIKNFKSYGIRPIKEYGYIQTFDLLEQKTENIQLKIGEETFEVLKDFKISPSVIMKRYIESELVFVGYGIEEGNYTSYNDLDIKGKTVFIMDGMPAKTELAEKWLMKDRIALAKKKGASVVLYHSPKLRDNLIKYEHYYSTPKLTLKEDVNDKEIIVIAATTELTQTITKAAGLRWKKILRKGIDSEKVEAIAFQLEVNKPTEKLTSENVLAFIHGSENPDEVVVLTAHYDHIGIDGDKVFNGADDDGSGTVTMLEIAQAFQMAVKGGLRPKRSILIMPVSGEEKGLLGSKYYTNNPVFPLENTVANLNVDMIGRYDENHKEGDEYIYLIGSDKLSSTLHNVSEKVNELYTEIELDYTFNDENDPNRFYYRSDQYNFAKNNTPVIFYFSGIHEDYHKETDTVEKIDFEKTARIARLVFLTAWEIANRDDRIKVDRE